MSFNRPGDDCCRIAVNQCIEKIILTDSGERGPESTSSMRSNLWVSFSGVPSSARTFSTGFGNFSGRRYSYGGCDDGFSGSCFGSRFGDSISSFFGGNGKQTMQNLNDRLASYLEKVHSLEESNTELERKIRECYEKQGTSGSTATQRDFAHYCKTIDELRAKILKSYSGKWQVVMDLDSFRLAASDFRLLYENQLGMRQRVEADINRLRRVLDEVTMTRSDLEMQIDSLAEELAYLKKNHEEEMGEMRGQMSGQLRVEMDAAPGIDLTKLLGEMREQYEMMGDKNRRDAEARFIASSEKLRKDVMANVEQMQSGKSEITELRRSLQGLEIELQSEFSKKISLKDLLSEIECRYGTQLHQMQSTITRYEAQLKGLRSDMEGQSLQYKTLLDVKNRLEVEISMYRQLLENSLNGQHRL